MMVVGGMGSITGSIVSVIGFTIVLEWLRNLESQIAVYGIHYIIFALIFMIIIIFRPQGLFGTREISEKVIYNLFPQSKRKIPGDTSKRGEIRPI